MYRRVGRGGAYYTYNMYMHMHMYINTYASYINMYSGGVGRGGAYDILSFSSANIIYIYTTTHIKSQGWCGTWSLIRQTRSPSSANDIHT